MNCPCGCGKEVKHGCFWATRYCYKTGRKKGIYMPANGEWRADTRIHKKMNLLKKGKDDGQKIGG
jgi:hypothetical protein